MISLSTKLLTVARISVWTSVRSAVWARRVIGRSSGTPVSVVPGGYGPPPSIPRGVPGHGERDRRPAGAVTVAAVITRPLVPLAAVALLAACSSGTGTTAGTGSTAASGSAVAEPSPAVAQAS